jgi:tRNA1(Val) A37 N6-methylase TrmN6
MLQFNKLLDSGWDKNPVTHIEKLLFAWMAESGGDKKNIKNLFLDYDLPNQDDDLIGAFYQSIQSRTKKSTLGAYYTPRELLREIRVPAGKTVYDPCCGSGGILLKILDKTHDPAQVFAGDIDDTALKICAVNLSLFFNNGSIKSQICRKDIVFPDDSRLYDYIVTNPPWGYRFTLEQKKNILRQYPELETTEIFSIALNNCLAILRKNGILYFFLPHAFLNVAAHNKIRQKLLNQNGNIALRLLGSAFRGVMSECVLLRFEAADRCNNTISITDKTGKAYNINKAAFAAPDFIISATVKNTDALVLEKIYAVPYSSLKTGTVFALGIVTGNNGQFLQKEKTDKNEAIYRGKDIFPYRFHPPKCFIEFEPEKMQQVAQTELYRQKKIVYRFICSRLICALDETGALFLNSANLLISHDYPMETIACLFNSPVYTFIFQKKFHSRKILKSHLQDLPLPVLSRAQHGFFYSMHSGLARGEISPRAGQPEIDRMLAGLFNLSGGEYNMILKETNFET